MYKFNINVNMAYNIKEECVTTDYYDKKFDMGKTQWSLLPLEAIEGIVKVLEYGLEKYKTRDSWQSVVSGEIRYFDAMMRHIVAIQRGEELDQESGLPHIWHVATNAMFLCWFRNHRKEHVCTNS